MQSSLKKSELLIYSSNGKPDAKYSHYNESKYRNDSPESTGLRQSVDKSMLMGNLIEEMEAKQREIQDLREIMIGGSNIRTDDYDRAFNKVVSRFNGIESAHDIKHGG